MLAVARPYAVGLTGFASNRNQVAGGADCAPGFIIARTAIIAYPSRRRTRTAKRAEFELASSTYSVLNRTRRLPGSYGRSASRGQKLKSCLQHPPAGDVGAAGCRIGEAARTGDQFDEKIAIVRGAF
jgi:hypothetical protein